MRKLISFLMMLAVASVVCASAAEMSALSTKVTKRVSGLIGFTQISCSGSMKVVYTESSATAISMTGSEAALEYVQIKKKGATLYVQQKQAPAVKRLFDRGVNGEVVVMISAPDVNQFDLCGSVDLVVPAALRRSEFALSTTGATDVKMLGISANRMTISATGSSDIKVNSLSGGNVAVKTTGATDVNIVYVKVRNLVVANRGSAETKICGGTADKAVYQATGASEIKASKVICQNVEAKASGASEIECHADHTIKASASTASEIECSGKAKLLSENSSNVKRKK